MDKDCSVYKTADFIGKRWTLLILLELYRGKKIKRYSQIKENLHEITPKMLSTRFLSKNIALAILSVVFFNALESLSNIK